MQYLVQCTRFKTVFHFFICTHYGGVFCLPDLATIIVLLIVIFSSVKNLHKNIYISKFLDYGPDYLFIFIYLCLTEILDPNNN